MSMLTPLTTYTPHIVDGFAYSSSPEPNTDAFSHSINKANYHHSGRLTPQTPESFSYAESLPIADPFDQYMNMHPWSHDGQMHIGLGFESDIPELMPVEQDIHAWTPDFNTHTTNMRHYERVLCDSPASANNAWATPVFSGGPSQPPHTRAVPSLSLSECSAQESDSPSGAHDEWPRFHSLPHISNEKPTTSTPYLDSIKTLPMGTRIWEDDMISGMYPNEWSLSSWLTVTYNRLDGFLRPCTFTDV